MAVAGADVDLIAVSGSIEGARAALSPDTALVNLWRAQRDALREGHHEGVPRGAEGQGPLRQEDPQDQP